MTQIKIKRVYEEPADTDGYRVLVDRLWPRGMKKEYLKYDVWERDITPSPEELEGSAAVKEFLTKIASYKVVTLLYASKEPVYNHARILQQYLETHLK